MILRVKENNFTTMINAIEIVKDNGVIHIVNSKGRKAKIHFPSLDILNNCINSLYMTGLAEFSGHIEWAK